MSLRALVSGGRPWHCLLSGGCVVSGFVPGEAAVPVDGGQDGAGVGPGHEGDGPGGVGASVAGGARVPGESGVS